MRLRPTHEKFRLKFVELLSRMRITQGENNTVMLYSSWKRVFSSFSLFISSAFEIEKNRGRLTISVNVYGRGSTPPAAP